MSGKFLTKNTMGARKFNFVPKMFRPKENFPTG